MPRTYQPPAHGPSTDYIPYHPPQSTFVSSVDHNQARPLNDGASPSRTSDGAGPDPSEFAPVSNLVNSAFRSSDVWPSSPVASSADQPLKVAENGKKKGVKDWREVERPMPRLGTGPRWCRFCEINKPDRTHHCRHCGTCVMQFDRE